jgi:hypothetical protein
MGMEIETVIAQGYWSLQNAFQLYGSNMHDWIPDVTNVF